MQRAGCRSEDEYGVTLLAYAALRNCAERFAPESNQKVSLERCTHPQIPAAAETCCDQSSPTDLPPP